MCDFGQLRTGAVHTTWTPHQLTVTVGSGSHEPARTVTAFTATDHQPITEAEALWWHQNGLSLAQAPSTVGGR